MTIKIYTKVGDRVNQAVTGKMVPKYDLQIEALGNVGGFNHTLVW